MKSYKNFIKIAITLLVCAFSLPSFSQPKIHPAGDGWHIRVDSALSHIKRCDLQKYNLLVEVCNEVEFWSSNFSSNYMLDGVGKIYISNMDMKIESINNLACVLVHESLHLFFLKKEIKISKKEEERLCYLYELELLNKIPSAESWLIHHTKNKIKQHS